MMAAALMGGLTSIGLLTPGHITVSDVHEPTLKKHQAAGFVTTQSNVEVVNTTHIVWLAVKPMYVATVLTEIAPHMTKDHLLISIAAGVTIQTMESCLPPGVSILSGQSSIFFHF